jgi:hypothetical protein
MKKVETRKIPSYKWVVEDLCSRCEATSPVVAVEPGAKVPPPPDTDAKLLYAEPNVIFPPSTAGVIPPKPHK